VNMDEPDNDLAEPLLGGDEEGASDEDDEDMGLDTDMKPHCLGHRFHWAEVAMLLMMPTGLVLFFVSQGAFIPGMNYIAGGMGFGANIVALMMVWNLASLKKLAAATDAIVEDIKRLRAENKRAKGMQTEMKNQDAQFKKNLGDMKQASVLISASAKSLEDVKKDEEKLMEERRAMLEERKKLAGKMEEDMLRSIDVSFDNMREEFDKRAMLYYEEGLKLDPDLDGINVTSLAFQELKRLLADNSIDIDESVAGDDGILDKKEFTDFLDMQLGTHFTKLKDSAMRNHQMEMKLLSEKVENITC